MTSPAPARQRILAQARFEARTLLSNGEQLLVAIILPVLALIGLHVTSSPTLGEGRRVDLAVPGILALSIISAAFTSQAIATAFDRRYDVLRYLGTTPLGRSGLIVGKLLAVLLVEAIQLAVIGSVGLAMGWRPHVVGLALATIVVALGSWTFVALALLLGGTVRAEGVLAIANLLWVLFLVGGGVILPRSEMPAAVSPVVGVLPSSALGDGLRAALVEGRLDVLACAVLVGWALAASALARRLFRWGD